MEAILTKMHEALKSNGYTNRQLAKRFDVTHTTVNSYFKNQSKFDFMHFVDVLRLFEPKDIEFRRECIKKIIPSLSHKNLKLALEVLDMFGEYDLQQLVINKIQSYKLKEKNENQEEKKKKSNSKTIRTNIKLVGFYQLLRKRSENGITKEDFFSEANLIRKKIKITENEVQILSDLAVMYSYLDLSNYKMVDEYVKRIVPLINEIPKQTLGNSLSFRVKEMQGITYMHKENDINNARRVCLEIIHDPLNYYVSTKAVAYCKLGESYIFEDYEIAKSYIEKSLELLGEYPTNEKLKLRRKKVLNVLLFLKLYHKCELDTINPKDLDLAELAFLKINLNEVDEAIKILKGLEEENGFLSGFQLYYMGLAVGGEEGKKYFEKSIEFFSKTGDFFYIFLPQRALKWYN